MFKPGIFSLVAVIMLVMASTSFGYLLRVKRKTKASRMLLWFFLSIMLSALATLITNLDASWSWAFAPSQDALLILGGSFLIRFAYSYPKPENSVESRWAGYLFAGITALALGYSLFYAYQFFSNLPVEIDEIQAYYLLTPITILGVVLVMFKRSLTVSWQAQGSKRSILPTLLRTQNIHAVGLRNLGLAISMGLIPAVVFITKTALPGWIASFLFNFGVVIAIGAIMLVYLNYAPEPTTITAKLVGITLVTILLILGVTCILILANFPGIDKYRLVSGFIAIVLFSSMFVLLVFPIFFKLTLFTPLARLLEGVKAVDEGRLDQQVEIRFEDELGILTRSFNRMIRSIRDLSTQQKSRAEDLEAEVVKRTNEVQRVNQQLIEENVQREIARKRLDRQLQYEQALAECSKIILRGEDNPASRRNVLTKALDVLRKAADADRAYLVQRYEDSKGDEFIRLYAEICASGVEPKINIPTNQNFPVPDLPQEFISTLESNHPIIGPTEEVFSGHPLAEYFLRQEPPLLSLLQFPIHLDHQFWGFIGFDDCKQVRDWNDSEITFLRTASEMMGGAIHRWEIRDQLEDALAALEQRVDERTQSLRETNISLQEEVETRRKLQDSLEHRLKAKRLLAKASAQLVEAQQISMVFKDMLRDLGEIMRAQSLTLVIVDEPLIHQEDLKTFIWHLPSVEPIDTSIIKRILEPSDLIYPLLQTGQSIFIDEQYLKSVEGQALRDIFTAESESSHILWPLIVNHELMGMLMVCGSAMDEDARTYHMQSLEVFIRLLTGLLERDRIMRTLEMRVTEQTRELSAMYEMTMLTSSSKDISDVLSPALAKIQEISKSEAACIHLYSPKLESLEIVAHRGLPQEVVNELKLIPIDDRFVDWLERPEPDYTRSRDLPADIPEQFCFSDFNSIIMSKLRVADTTQGLISCFREAMEQYTPFQTSMMAVIGELLGVVIENHKLTVENEKQAMVQERQRLARDLHDAVSQSVYSLSLFARSARDAQESGDEQKLADSLQQLEENSVIALREMRLLLYQLRSIALEDANIEQAIESRLNMVERRLGISASFDVSDGVELPNDVEQDFFHIITEALNNVLNHAAASKVAVGISKDSGQLHLYIEDDGVGFDPKKVRKGMGLQNIRERLHAYNGNLEISSQPNQGTRLDIYLPMVVLN